MVRAPYAHVPEPASSALARRLATPEGLELHLTLGSAGERVAAFCIDAMIMIAVLIVASVAAIAVLVGGRGGGGEVLMMIWLLGAFLLRNGYFILFELSGRAASPGKRALGLRVIARDGGPLTAAAVVTRNALREIEVFLPLTLLGASVASGDPVDSAVATLGLLWSAVFLLFPLFNRDRLRVGDLVAGSWVVRTPRVTLLADLTRAGNDAPLFAFTPDQITAYGVKELEILESVLRRGETASLAAVARRIRVRIGYPAAAGEADQDFLNAFYTALRGRLEHRLLFGHRRKDKFDHA